MWVDSARCYLPRSFCLCIEPQPFGYSARVEQSLLDWNLMTTHVRINRTYIDRTIYVALGLNVKGKIGEIHLRRLRRALAVALYRAFDSQGHHHEELLNFGGSWDQPQRSKFLRAKIVMISNVQRDQVVTFVELFQQLLKHSGDYTTELVRGLRRLGN